MLPPTRSSPPTAKPRCNGTRTAIPKIKTEAEHNFRQASEAYSVLSDPQKRSIYDRFGHAGLGNRGFETAASTRQSSRNFRIFSATCSASRKSLAEDGAARARCARPARRRFALRHVADLRRSRRRCHQQDSPHAPRKLRSLQRHGREIRHGHDAPARPAAAAGRWPTQQGFFSITRTCPACQGAGQVIRDACAACRGQGRIERERTLEVGVPAGVDSGTRLRMAGQGEPGTNGGADGRPLYFSRSEGARVSSSAAAPIFICTIPVSFPQAALGRHHQSSHAAGRRGSRNSRRHAVRPDFPQKRERPSESARRHAAISTSISAW